VEGAEGVCGDVVCSARGSELLGVVNGCGGSSSRGHCRDGGLFIVLIDDGGECRAFQRFHFCERHAADHDRRVLRNQKALLRVICRRGEGEKGSVSTAEQWQRTSVCA
jgi:hypothetical protein